VDAVASPPEDILRQIYAETTTIAVVGASDDPTKHARSIPEYLQSQGYRIVPINAHGGEILGETAYTSLLDVEIPVDVVDVFRPPAEAPRIAEEAASIGAKVLWLQRGIVSDEARRIAEEHGLVFVENICMGATHAILGITPRD
jgi:predicted CoA-binding protein